MVTHDLGSVMKYCDRVILLNKGEKVSEGLPGDMVDLYKKILAGRFTEEDRRYAQHQTDAQAAAEFIDGQNFGVDSVGAAALAEGEAGPATHVQLSKDAPSGEADAGDRDADASADSGTWIAIWSPSKSALNAVQHRGCSLSARPSTSTGSNA